MTDKPNKFAERAKEKQASREQDEKDLQEGKTRQELADENSMFSGLRRMGVKFRINWEQYKARKKW